MKRISLGLLAIFVYQFTLAQNPNKVTINPVKQNEQELTNKMYQYDQFTAGQAIYKNGTVTAAKLNYSYLTNMILFIDAKGDTLELSQGENFREIVIGVDTFYYCKKEFLQQITHNPVYNLLIRRSLKYNGQEKKGAYGTYSGTTSTSSYNNITPTEGGGVMKLTSDVNTVYIFSDDYYFIKNSDQVYPATKKGVSKLFSGKQQELNNFLEQKQINFNNKEDLYKILAFAASVLK